jgi:PAS domain S-box-containing protein
MRSAVPPEHALELLAQSEQRWKHALDIAGHGVWDWDLVAGATHLSTGMADILGLPRGTPIDGDHWLDWLHPEDKQAARACMVAHLRGETAEVKHECRLIREDGRMAWISVRGQVLLRDAGGRAQRVMGVVSDVTELRQAETLKRDKQAAELAAKAKARFLSRASHEMRTPLNAVIGFASLMQDPEVVTHPERVREYARLTLTAGRQLLDLVNDLLDLQRAENGRLRLRMAPVAVRSILQTVFDQARAESGSRRLQLVDAVEGQPLVQADAARLLQALTALVSSAQRSHHAGGIVRVSVEAAGASRWRVVVEDNGPGLGAEEARLLFQPFERPGGEAGSIDSVGLSLLLARSFTEAMGGRLELSTRPGIGTRAWVELERAEAATVAAPSSAALSPPEPGPGRLLKLLYVEDNRVNALLFREAMRTLAHTEVRVAEDGVEAMELLEAWLPDVLVLDANLPGVSGYDLLAQLRRVRGLGHLPAFMCSADAAPEDLARARQAGFAGYWVKPIDFSQILSDLNGIRSALRE